jgi:hypothetical protein
MGLMARRALRRGLRGMGENKPRVPAEGCLGCALVLGFLLFILLLELLLG